MTLKNEAHEVSRSVALSSAASLKRVFSDVQGKCRYAFFICETSQRSKTYVNHANKCVRSKFHCQKDRQTDSPLRPRWAGKSEGTDRKTSQNEGEEQLKEEEVALCRN